MWSLLLFLAAAVGSVPNDGAEGCGLDAACVAGVASTIGYFENNSHGVAQHLSCAQMWSEAIASNSGASSIHHRCPASAGVGGAVAWLQPSWRACAAAVTAAGGALNVSVCEYKPAFMKPHSLHSDLAVLQSGKPCFTGLGVPGDTVSVTVTKDADASSADTLLSTAASSDPVAADGYWRVCLSDPIAAALGNHTVNFTGAPSGSRATNNGVLVGNVILCSGQSNMEKAIGYAFNATAELAATKALANRIRTAGPVGPWNHNVDGGAAPSPQYDTKLPMAWHAYGGSAICWMYGRRIQERYPTIPLGLLQAHVGGTAIEPWSPPAALAACDVAERFFPTAKNLSCPPYCNTSSLYNGMIAPLLNYTLHHVLWYQGESNCGDSKYGCSQMAMVREWRNQWAAANTGNGNVDWPFGFVELAGYHRVPSNESQVVSQLRRQQQLAAALDKTFFAVAMDLSDPAVVTDLQTGPGGEVHSRFKEQVGRRLSLGGRAVAFGEADLEWRGPAAATATLCQHHHHQHHPHPQQQPPQQPAAAAAAGPSTAAVGSTDAVCVKFTHVGEEGCSGLLDYSQRSGAGFGPLFEFGYSDGSWENATSAVRPGGQASNDTIVLVAVVAIGDKDQNKDKDNGGGGKEIMAVRYAQYNEPCDPSNDHPGMSPGGGGENGARPTLGNMTANVTCSLYSRCPDGAGGSVLLPAPSFWLNVSR